MEKDKIALGAKEWEDVKNTAIANIKDGLINLEVWYNNLKLANDKLAIISKVFKGENEEIPGKKV